MTGLQMFFGSLFLVSGLWVCLAAFSGIKFIDAKQTVSDVLTEIVGRCLFFGIGVLMVWAGYALFPL